MAKKELSGFRGRVSAQPRFQQTAGQIQAYGTVTHFPPLELDSPVRLEMTEQLNQLLADTITLRDLYKKSHWQVAGPTCYQLHLLYDKHYEEQNELVDSIAERIGSPPRRRRRQIAKEEAAFPRLKLRLSFFQDVSHKPR